MFGRKNLKRSLFDNLPWFHNYEGDRIMIKLEEVYCACSSRWKQPCVCSIASWKDETFTVPCDISNSVFFLHQQYLIPLHETVC